MRIFAMIVNYIFVWLAVLACVSLIQEYSTDVLLGSMLFFIITIPNLIYLHMNKPIDSEKESLKKEINDLKSKLEK